jgi:ABC-2 type transport system ATP-binding protein
VNGADTAVWADDLHKTYRAQIRALDGLSFSVAPGSVYALLGPNGAGKTTTVRVLTTLSRPDAGRAMVAGIDVLRSPARVRSAIGAVGQRTGSVRQLTGYENLTMQGKIHGMARREIPRRAADLLQRFGLGDAAARQVRTYSGGMQRRLDIAIALVHQPKVLFLDEPTAGLDPEGRADLWSVLTGMAEDSGMTIFLTTHYLEEADQFAAKIGIVDRGRLVAEGTADELKAQLRGDSVQLELQNSGRVAQARDILTLVPEVAAVTADGAALRARVGDGARALPGVLASLQQRGIPVTSVTVARPSLDDVYLHYAGRSFRQAEGTLS